MYHVLSIIKSTFSSPHEPQQEIDQLSDSGYENRRVDKNTVAQNDTTTELSERTAIFLIRLPHFLEYFKNTTNATHAIIQDFSEKTGEDEETIKENLSMSHFKNTRTGKLNEVAFFAHVAKFKNSIPADDQGNPACTLFQAYQNYKACRSKIIATDSTILGVFYNNLTSLPPEIGQLRDLKTLGVQCNKLTFLPTEIGQLTNLERLNVLNNRLTSLPTEIGQL